MRKDSAETLELPLEYFPRPGPDLTSPRSLAEALAGFREFGQRTRQSVTTVTLAAGGECSVPTYINEFWTARQRAANSLHEISYRACFKPQLPVFFIERLTRPGARVYDPFMGRGTTLIEAALRQRIPLGCDINPLSLTLVRPRLHPPELGAVSERLRGISLEESDEFPEDTMHNPRLHTGPRIESGRRKNFCRALLVVFRLRATSAFFAR